MSSPRSGSPESQPQSVVGKEGVSSAKDRAQGEGLRESPTETHSSWCPSELPGQDPRRTNAQAQTGQ